MVYPPIPTVPGSYFNTCGFSGASVKTSERSLVFKLDIERQPRTKTRLVTTSNDKNNTHRMFRVLGLSSAV